MKRRGAARDAAKIQRGPSRGPIGFAVRDMDGRGGAYEIDQSRGEALVFGSQSPLRVSAHGVLPAHFVVLPHDGRLVAASASAQSPAILNGTPLSTTWTVLEVPSRIRIGGAAVDFFYVRESGTVLIDLDVETTVADPGRAPAPEPIRSPAAPALVSPLAPRLDLDRTRVASNPDAATRAEEPVRGKLLTPSRALPPISPPPMRLGSRPAFRQTSLATSAVVTGPSGSPTALGQPRPALLQATLPATLRATFRAALERSIRAATTARRLVVAGYVYARLLWKTATMSTRVLLGVVALLLVFLVARSGGGSSRVDAPAGAERPPPAASPIPTGVPVKAVRLVNDPPTANAASAVPGVAN